MPIFLVFSNGKLRFDILSSFLPVSYTHLDVYKRQIENKAAEEKVTQVYEPRPLTPDDDIYEDIIEQFASAPTKPKYWFEEFGDYWSCSCGHINKGDRCKSCGLERDLLRSLFILHKPAGTPGKLNKMCIRDSCKAYWYYPYYWQHGKNHNSHSRTT